MDKRKYIVLLALGLVSTTLNIESMAAVQETELELVGAYFDDKSNFNEYDTKLAEISETNGIHCVEIIHEPLITLDISEKDKIYTYEWVNVFYNADNSLIASDYMGYTFSSTYLKNATGHAKQCTGCNYIQNYTAHSYPSTYQYNSTSHWRNCSTCGYKNGVGHDYIYSGTYKTCRVCGYRTTVTNGTSIGDEEASTEEAEILRKFS